VHFLMGGVPGVGPMDATTKLLHPCSPHRYNSASAGRKSGTAVYFFLCHKSMCALTRCALTRWNDLTWVCGNTLAVNFI